MRATPFHPRDYNSANYKKCDPLFSSTSPDAPSLLNKLSNEVFANSLFASAVKTRIHVPHSDDNRANSTDEALCFHQHPRGHLHFSYHLLRRDQFLNGRR